MFVQQFFVKGLAHSSYLLAGNRTCAIVDPRRDIDVYLEAARDMGVQITHILETHLHADFVSGHIDLAKVTGATIYAPQSAQCAFEHVALAEGDAFEIEDMSVEVLETPGHTPEHISYVVKDTARGPAPAALFCGDTLFVGDVGRPDLFPGRAQELADKLFDSLHQKIMKLPDFCEVYPAHGAGSLCGRAMGAKRSSTIGYEREYNAAVAIKDRQEFIESLTTNMPGAPDHFSRCSAINAEGPALVEDTAVPAPMAPKTFYERSRDDDTIVLDTRSYSRFGGHHVPGAYHIDLGGNFPTFAGWVLPPDKKILLVSSDPEEAASANVWLKRVGLDSAFGYLDGGLFEWAKAGLPTEHVAQISVHELKDLMSDGEQMALVDVRSPREFEGGHIEGAINIPTPDLRTRHQEFDPRTPTAVICSTGHRSSLATSLFEQHGFRNLRNVAGGMTGYSAAGFAPECPVCIVPHGPRFIG